MSDTSSAVTYHSSLITIITLYAPVLVHAIGFGDNRLTYAVGVDI